MKNVDSLYVTRTYGGFLMGSYETCNRYLERSIREQAKQLVKDVPWLFI